MKTLIALSLASLSLGAQTISIQGAGATFPQPLYTKWVSEYQKIDPRVQVNYQGIGSGGGIRQILEKTVDFGATDAPMTAQERAKAKSTLHHLPMTLGAVVLAYNLPGGPSQIKLTPELLSGIFLGEIKHWNDPKISAINGGAKFPATAITVAYRSDGSGTTAVFTEYLATVSQEWKNKVGAGKAVKFPVGLGAKGNEGVTGTIKSVPGSIGYIELAYAKQNKLAIAQLKNKAGKFVEPSLKGVTAAAAGVPLQEDLTASIVDAAGAEAYPISSYSYILVYENMDDSTKGKALADFLWWATHNGQKFAEALDYATLPKEHVNRIENRLKSLKAAGQSLIKK